MNPVIDTARITVPYEVGPSALAASKVARKAKAVPSQRPAEA